VPRPAVGSGSSLQVLAALRALRYDPSRGMHTTQVSGFNMRNSLFMTSPSCKSSVTRNEQLLSIADETMIESQYDRLYLERSSIDLYHAEILTGSTSKLLTILVFTNSKATGSPI